MHRSQYPDWHCMNQPSRLLVLNTAQLAATAARAHAQSPHTNPGCKVHNNEPRLIALLARQRRMRHPCAAVKAARLQAWPGLRGHAPTVKCDIPPSAGCTQRSSSTLHVLAYACTWPESTRSTCARGEGVLPPPHMQSRPSRPTARHASRPSPAPTIPTSKAGLPQTTHVGRAHVGASCLSTICPARPALT